MTISKEEKAKTVIQINPAMQRHFELEIKTMQDAPRDADKLIQILKIKQREYETSKIVEEIEKIVSEIEMLKFVLYLVKRNSSS